MATKEEGNNDMYEEDEEDVVVGEGEEETDEDLDEEEEEEEEEEDENEEDLHSDFLTTTAITATIEPPVAPAIVALPSSSSVITITTTSASALDNSRRLCTDEYEIGLLQEFLEFTTERGSKNSAYHHDTTPFYDQIKSKLQLDFNKNQLVEKLRRLKKKYRNVMNQISSGKDIAFKTPNDQATFEISRKIWSGIGEPGIEDEELLCFFHSHRAANLVLRTLHAHVPRRVQAYSRRGNKAG